MPGKKPVLDLPRSPDAEMQAMLDRAREAIARYSASSGKDFRPPAVSAPLPCPESDRYERSHEVDTRISLIVRDVRIWPVAGACVDGQLDGQLDFWIFGTHVTALGSTNPLVTASPMLRHVTATMARGKPVGRIMMETRAPPTLVHSGLPTDIVVKRKTGYSSEAMYLQLDDAEHGDDGRALTVGFNKGPYAKEGELVTQMTLPVSIGVTVSTIFSGLKPHFQSFKKNGLFHGKHTLYGIGPKGADLVSCYREGKFASDSNCTAQ